VRLPDEDRVGQLGSRLWTRAHLLSPEINALAQQVRLGEVKDLPAVTAPEHAWDERTRDALLIWFRTLAPQNLAHLLARVPSLIHHPLVGGQIEHLRRLASPKVVVRTEQPVNDTEVTDTFRVPVRNIFRVTRPRRPIGTRIAAAPAQEYLARIITAWVSGLLPSWKVDLTPPVPRGRPAEFDVFQKLVLAVHVRDLRAALGALPLRDEELAVGEAVAELSGRITIEPILGLYGNTLTVFPATTRDPVSGETAVELVQLARSLPKVPQATALAYALLANDLWSKCDLGWLKRVQGEVEQAHRIWPGIRRHR
jgi:hypothetical protein